MNLQSTDQADRTETDRIWTVTELTHAVRELIEESLVSVWLTGEIGNLTIHRSGHVYFTLKDAACQVKAVYFRGAEKARSMGLSEGMEVEIHGKVTVYEARGEYQINVRVIRPKGIGDLQRQFELLKQMLKEEGLFDEDRKQPVPVLPRCVGIVTSTEGAALRDFLNIIQRRFKSMHVRVVPAAVQGPAAAAEVAAGVEFLNRTQACDVIVVTRGGGSIEDLWAFNEEVVARAVAASRIPVISAVGHEVDFTICDFVADLRVPTPSAAAELVVGQKADMLDTLRRMRKQLVHALEVRVRDLRHRVEASARHYVFREPLNLIRAYQQRVDDLSLRLTSGTRHALDLRRQRLSQLHGQLHLLDPHQVLQRGYSILIHDDGGKAVMSTDDVSTGDTLRAIVSDGEIPLEVMSKK